MAKKILIVDDSALMRRVLCDIINSDKRFEVVAQASNGVEAFDLLSRNTYDAVVLDIYMPKMNGIELLEALHKHHISARVMMASSYARKGAQITLDALELGALDFIHKPENAMAIHDEDFKESMLRVLEAVANSEMPVFESRSEPVADRRKENDRADITKRYAVNARSKNIVAIASSTGGPKALHSVILKLPADLDAPVLVVQHMPKGFTASLAERLNTMGHIRVKEAEEGEELRSGVVYFARGGSHMNIRKGNGGQCVVQYSDEPPREGVKPCANYMYESLADCPYERVICVVMTGMGADGTEGIDRLKKKKKVYVISQDEKSCTVYGMPKSVVQAGLSDLVVPLEQIAQEVIAQVGHAPQQR